MTANKTVGSNKFIYEGKFIDRFPNYSYAGKNSIFGRETVAECLKFPTDKPPTPEPCVRLRQWTNTPLEKRRIFPAQINDPQLERARNLVHGIDYPPGPGAADLINPVPHSVYQQRFTDKLESLYESNKKKPLGRVPDPINFPDDFDYRHATFGIKSEIGENAKELINPNKSSLSIYNEEIKDHDYYLKSHKHLYPGEQSKRGYSANPRFAKMEYFGVPTPCNREGLLTKACLRWHTDKEYERRTPLVDKRLDDFRERYTPQIGLPLDPIKDSMIVNPDHRFGMKSQADLYKVSDLMHGKVPYYFNTGPNREKAVMGAIRNHLRSLHYSHHKDLYDACNLLDTAQTGLLSEDSIRTLARQFDIPIDPQLMEQGLNICYRDGKIDWKKFANIFDWQERVDYSQIQPDYSYSGDPCESNLPDWNLQNRLQRDVEKDISTWTTSSSMYNGGGILKGKNFPALGSPSLRTDLPIPKVRKTVDRISYGDEGGAGCVMNPSIMTAHGITEMDLLIPRTKEQCLSLYENLFPNGGSVPFERIWGRCAEISKKTDETGIINVDVFKKAVIEFENMRIKKELEQKSKFVAECSNEWLGVAPC